MAEEGPDLGPTVRGPAPPNPASPSLCCPPSALHPQLSPLTEGRTRSQGAQSRQESAEKPAGAGHVAKKRRGVGVEGGGQRRRRAGQARGRRREGRGGREGTRGGSGLGRVGSPPARNRASVSRARGGGGGWVRGLGGGRRERVGGRPEGAATPSRLAPCPPQLPPPQVSPLEGRRKHFMAGGPSPFPAASYRPRSVLNRVERPGEGQPPVAMETEAALGMATGPGALGGAVGDRRSRAHFAKFAGSSTRV